MIWMVTQCFSFFVQTVLPDPEQDFNSLAPDPGGQFSIADRLHLETACSEVGGDMNVSLPRGVPHAAP
jgi:hypothetical protein